VGSGRWKEYQWWRQSEILIPSSKSEWLTAEPPDLEAPRTTLGIAAVAAIPDIVGAAVFLAVKHVAATFILVLNWWLVVAGARSPRDADAVFRALATPVFAV